MCAWTEGILPPLGTDAIAIAWADVSGLQPDIVDRWRDALPQHEQARYARFQHERSAYEFLLGRRLVRQWLWSLTGHAPAGWTFQEGPRGRPEIASPSTSLRFNLAHSGGIVACVMTDGHEAGVDVEDLERRPVERELWHRFCAPSEADDIERCAEIDRQRRFLTYWTLKEAYLKARGLGIAVHLADVAFDVSGPRPRITFRESLVGTPDAWWFGVTDIAPHHLISWALPWADEVAPMVTITHVPLSTLDVSP